MAKFITVGYGDETGYKRTAPPLRDAAHAHDARLRAGGSLIGMAGKPVQVRNHFAVIEAKNLDEAIALVSKTPCAVAHGVVEIWPLLEMPAADDR